MAIREVTRMGNPVLREEAEELTAEEILSAETKELLQDMYDTMKAESGIGIAAPQIGVSKKVALIAVPEESERYPEAKESPMLYIFNPKITVLDEELQGFWEGCLSVPGLRGFVERPRKVQIDFLDINANSQSIVIEGFLATVFQHELDHLFGKLYVDRITDMSKLTFNEEFSKYVVGEEQGEE
jgi:peptide deformylase